MDIEKAEAALKVFLEALDQDLTDPNLTDTPKRVTKMFCEELLNYKPFNVTTFDTAVGSQFVSVFDINVSSMCSHHLQSISGRAHIGTFYIADNKNSVRLPGLSKYARVVDMFSRRLQLQERLTFQVADYITEQFGADFVYVHLDCKHNCMSHRGIKDVNSNTTTTQLRISDRYKQGNFDSRSMINDFYHQLAVRSK